MAIRRFRLSESFIDQYRDRIPPWGPVGYPTYKRTYSRRLPEGGTEEWYQTCRRVIEGMFDMQKQHIGTLGLEWNDQKAQRTAKDAYERLFIGKWTPPGRGLWMMGTDFVRNKTAAGLFNCAFRSTKDLKDKGGYLFAWIMDALMVGIGVGFDTLGAGTITIMEPGTSRTSINIPHNSVNAYTNGTVTEDGDHQYTCEIADSREGWTESIQVLLNAWFLGHALPVFNYDLIRPYGTPIKGFGGTASGYGPLKQLHEDLCTLFENKVGELITSVDITDTENLIGKCVVAGNVRRSAALALGEPEDLEFLQMKQDPVALESHRWGSNNSFKATVGMDYSWHAAQSAQNGEPGYIWMDVARTRGRMADPPIMNDLAIMGFNPCVAADTWVATSKGYKQVKDLIGNDNWRAYVDGEYYELESNGFWQTGTKNIYQLQTVEGYSLKLTNNHQVKTTRGWVEAQNLTDRDEIVLNNHRATAAIRWPHWPSTNRGTILGMLVGDGTFADGKAILSFWDKELYEAYCKNIPLYKDILESATFIPERGEYRVRRKRISDLAERAGIKQGSKHNIEHLLDSSYDFIIGFIRGLFDADGTVIDNHKKGSAVRLTQSNLELLEVVQKMLLRVGITSTIYQNRRQEGPRPLPDGQGGTKDYHCKASHELHISGEDLIWFNNKIGFMTGTAKAIILQQTIDNYKRAPNKTKFTARFKSLTLLGREPVYDVTVRDIHAFDANGIVVHNCVEQQLEDGECCCLTETFPARHDSYEDWQQTLKIAYLYAKTVTLAKTHWPETNAIMLKNRRIGLSQSGVIQAFNKFGRREILQWSDRGYNYIKDLDATYSDWLCVPRSKRTTSIKPSGTVSKLFGATPGIHHPEAEYYIQRIRFSQHNDMLAALIKAGYRHEPCVYSPNTEVVEFPVHEEHFVRGKNELSMWEQLEIAAAYQHWWADNSVSVTITFKAHEATEIARALEMYETRLKAVSFLPYSDHGYKQAPMEAITQQEYELMISEVTPVTRLATDEQGAGTKFCDGDSCEI